MKKRVVAILMATVVAVGSLAGCGSKGGNGGEASTEEGKVINIYSWNDEFRERLEAVYPEVESTSKDGTVTTLKDGTEIHWIINPNQDGVYQQKLDEALMKQADVDTDDKVDIFLSETDYVYKYTDAEADTAVPLKDLGIDPDKDLADQYDFTKTTASDADGVQRGSTWQCCPGTMVYRRDIAKEVFGTDDPTAVGEKVKENDYLKNSKIAVSLFKNKIKIDIKGEIVPRVEVAQKAQVLEQEIIEGLKSFFGLEHTVKLKVKVNTLSNNLKIKGGNTFFYLYY